MYSVRFHLLLSSFALLSLSSSLVAAPVFLDTCADCHDARGMGGDDPMVPVIVGIPAGHIEEAIYAYVDGARSCVRIPRMCETVAALSEPEVIEIAEYYADQERDPSAEAYDSALAAEGALLHEEHCSNCHWAPDRDGVEDAVGIPLHGQKKEYIRFALEAYMAGDRETLVPAMADAIAELRPGDLGALTNYYASYRSSD
jgi:cytochrome c553